ncbi:MAG: 5'-methylthioadenosine/S-adenosylhomocysteine nucleosidase [Kosmotogaceae bacterium]
MILSTGVFLPEIKPIIDGMTTLETGEILGRTYNRGVIGQNEIVATSGFVGKVETAVIIQKFIDVFNPNQIVFTSGVGALDENLEPGTIVVGTEFQQYDVFLPMRSGMVSVNTDDTPAIQHLKEHAKKIIFCKIISGDKIVMNKKERDSLHKRFNALCLDMDSAVLARVASMNNVGFTIVKVVLDYCDENSEKDFSINFEKYGHLPAELITELLKKHVLDFKKKK